ncbi:hypothetical protein FE249_19180 (plasmid) [Acidiphilium multivorum]|uniref:gamma-mobile-trio protein GmtX n=1 Tax=Acidiphilium multivorum TaxID=62140 RepID=UPI001F4C06D7|nr:gamma-mobile-trio protein GmtX [Acidiphilium multivorum]UNC15899.1 hypothetical protein FE249_17550 [Acidiphilium multivorum]UNC16331.1 hypothetical protein FE249_19180 [Acidiphilium multivorum]
MTIEEVKALKDRLVVSRHTQRAKDAVDAIWLALEAMRQRHVVTYAVSAVVRTAEELCPGKAPALQTVRNKMGKDYRQLIDLYSRAAGANRPEDASPTLSRYDRVIDGIDNIEIRTQMKILLRDFTRERNQANVLRQLLARVSIPAGGTRPPPQISGPEHGASLNPEEALTEFDIKLMEKLSDKKEFERRGLEPRDNGEVRTLDDMVVLPAGSTQTFARVAKFLRSSSLAG